MYRSIRCAAVAILTITLLAVPVLASHPPAEEVAFQASAFAAFLDGLYEGTMTCGELLAEGDTGLGTFNGVDGEMIVYDGHVFQARCEGTVSEVESSTLTPFAMVTFFDSDIELESDSPLTYGQFEQWLDKQLPTLNMFYAIYVKGSFSSVTARSIPKQSTRPYKPFTEVVKSQSVYTIPQTEGVLIGFRSPSFVEGIGVPGYHLHFLSKDGSTGGHVLDFAMERGCVQLDLTPAFCVALPETDRYYNLDINTETLSEDRERAEH